MLRLACYLLTLIASAAVAQSEAGMTMDGDMMMSGWALLACALFGILILVALILSILALLKYLFGKKT